MRIILASASPRRRELLTQIGVDFEVIVSDVEEKVTADLPHEVVMELSAQKAESVMKDLSSRKDAEQTIVIGADTVVSCGGEILGKPKDAEDAGRMLRMLSGREHEVYTGVSFVYSGCEKPHTFYECTKVKFAPMTEREIEEYIATKDPMDKAGAYGIQGFCARYIEGIEGDYNNVVGLPVCRVYQELKKLREDRGLCIKL